jgi:hypothetical protein
MNNDSQCLNFLAKLNLLRKVNKTIKNHYTNKKLLTEVADSGFLIVKGTFKEFG